MRCQIDLTRPDYNNNISERVIFRIVVLKALFTKVVPYHPLGFIPTREHSLRKELIM